MANFLVGRWIGKHLLTCQDQTGVWSGRCHRFAESPIELCQFLAAPTDPRGPRLADEHSVPVVINVSSSGAVDCQSRVMLKPPNRRRIVAPVESGKLKITATTDLESDSAKRGMLTVPLDDFANRRKDGVLYAWVERIVI